MFAGLVTRKSALQNRHLWEKSSSIGNCR